MAPTPVVSVGDGVRITVSDLLKDPLTIPQRMISLSENQFIADSVLRKTGAATAGVVRYDESTPLFAADEPAEVEEFGEFPLTTGVRGKPKTAYVVKRGLGVKISREMRDRNRTDELNRQITQVRNTIVRAHDRVFFTALQNAVTLQVPADIAWGTSGATIRKNILAAAKLVTQAQTGEQDDNWLGFQPDTLIISENTKYAILGDDDYTKVYQGNIADKNVQYTGKLENDIFGLTVLASRTCPDDTAFVLERNTIGGISDERPLQATPLRYNDDNETWRTNMLRASAVFIDQPLAVAKITGVQ